MIEHCLVAGTELFLCVRELGRGFSIHAWIAAKKTRGCIGGLKVKDVQDDLKLAFGDFQDAIEKATTQHITRYIEIGGKKVYAGWNLGRVLFSLYRGKAEPFF